MKKENENGNENEECDPRIEAAMVISGLPPIPTCDSPAPIMTQASVTGQGLDRDRANAHNPIPIPIYLAVGYLHEKRKAEKQRKGGTQVWGSRSRR